MKCNECKREMCNLFDSEADKTLIADLKEHLLECSDCLTEFREMEEVMLILKPQSQINAPFLLKQNVLNQVSKDDQKKKHKTGRSIIFNSTFKKILTMAAILTVIMAIFPLFNSNNGVMNNSAQAASSLIKSSIQATNSIETMVMKLNVRTVARDNFSLVGTQNDWVEHTISKSFGKPEKWRLDKGERTVVFDGKNQYLWIPKLEAGYKAGVNSNFTEWFKVLIYPETILLREQAGTGDNSSKFSMQEKNGELLMTVTSSARGNFINDYCKNKSIDQSDNRREYVFDSKTKLIKSLKVFIIEGEKETMILETKSINYNVAIENSVFTINLPQGAQWKDLTLESTLESETFSNITSKRAAEIIFEAMAKNNWESVDDVFSQFNFVTMKIFKMRYGGLEVIKIGESFKSGLYKGEYVPYEVKLKNGFVKKFKMALRNDNKNKVWLVDGGL
jgi:outer membrane lipoprotein-sorting protein